MATLLSWITDRSSRNNANSTDLRQEIAQYIPLIAYALLTLISGIRLYTHRIRGCCSVRTWYRFLCCRCKRYNGVTSLGSLPSAKFAFHTFLFLFAVGKTIATVLTLEASAMNDDGKGSLAALIMNSLSGCSYITLLLFLETHWRDILRPLEVVKAKNYAKVMATFILLNGVLYAFIGSVVYIEWVRNNGQVGSMFWSSDVIDGVLVCIAVSYTSTAIRMYRRIAQSLRMQEGLMNNPKERLTNSTVHTIENIRPKSNVQRPSISDGSNGYRRAYNNNPNNTNNSNDNYDSLDDNDSLTPPSGTLSRKNSTKLSSSILSSTFRRNNSNTNLAGERSPLMYRATNTTVSSSSSSSSAASSSAPQQPPTDLTLPSSSSSNLNESFGGHLRNGLSLIITSNDIISRSNTFSHNTNNNMNNSSSPKISRSLSHTSATNHPTHEYTTDSSSSARLYAVDGSGRQLRDALSVFITIMLSSAALLCVRTGLSLAFTGSVQNQWWYQVFVIWLPDVPPCLAYMMLMWPRDDDKRLAASSKSHLGQLFTKLLDEEDNYYYDNSADHNEGTHTNDNHYYDKHNRGISSNLNSPLLAGLNRSSISGDYDSRSNSPILKALNGNQNISTSSSNWLDNLVLKRNLSTSNTSNRTGVADSITSPLSTGTGTYQAPLLVLENETNSQGTKGTTINTISTAQTKVATSSSSPLLGSTPSPVTKRVRGSSLAGRVFDATVSVLQLRNKSNSNTSLDKLSNVSGDSLSREEEDLEDNINNNGNSNYRSPRGRYTDPQQGIELPLTLRLPPSSSEGSGVPVTLVGTMLNKLSRATHGFTIPCAEIRPLPSHASSLIRVSILTFSCTKVRAPPRHLLLRQALRKQQFNRVQRMRRHVGTYTSPYTGGGSTATLTGSQTYPVPVTNTGNKFITLGREHSNSTTGSGTDDNSLTDDDRYSFELEEEEEEERENTRSYTTKSTSVPIVSSASQPLPISKSRSFYPTTAQGNTINVMETIPSADGDSYLGTTLSSSTTNDDLAATYASSYIPQSLLTRAGKTKRHTVRSRVLRIASETNPPVSVVPMSVTPGITTTASANVFTSPRLTSTVLPSSSLVSSASLLSTSVPSSTLPSSVPPSLFHIQVPVHRTSSSVLAPSTPLFLPSTPLVLPPNTALTTVSGRDRRSSSSSTVSEHDRDSDSDTGGTRRTQTNTEGTKKSPTIESSVPFPPEPVVVRNGSLVTIIPAESLLHRGAYLSYLQSWLEYECYVVVCVGLRATRLRSSKSAMHPATIHNTLNGKLNNPLNDATNLAINHILSNPQNNHTNGSVLAWRYIGHTEPAYLEDESGFISGITNGNDTTPTDLMRMGVTLVDGEPVLSCGVGFGMSVPVPHSLIADAQEAAIALTKDAEITNASLLGNSSSTSVTNGHNSIRFDALVRFQLRWYDGEDEDRQMRIGRPSHGTVTASSPTTKKGKKRDRSHPKHHTLNKTEETSNVLSPSMTNDATKRPGSKRSLSPSSNRRRTPPSTNGTTNPIPYVPGGLIVPPTNAFADLATEVCTALAVKEEEYHQIQLQKQRQQQQQQQQTKSNASVKGRSRRGSSTGGASTSSNRSSRAASVAEALAILETGMGERNTAEDTETNDDRTLDRMNRSSFGNAPDEDDNDSHINVGNRTNRDTGRSRGASVFSMLLGGGFTNSSSTESGLTDITNSRFSTDKSAEDEYLLASWTVDAVSILQTMNTPGRIHVDEDNPLFTLSEPEQKALLKSRVHIHGQTNENSTTVGANGSTNDLSELSSPFTASKSRRGSAANLVTTNTHNATVSVTPNPQSSPSTTPTSTVMDDHFESLAFALDDGTRTRLTVQVERIISIRPGADLLNPGLYALGDNASIHSKHPHKQSLVHKESTLNQSMDDEDDDDEDVYEETDKYADHNKRSNEKSGGGSNVPKTKTATSGSIDTADGTDDPDYDDDAASVASLVSGGSNTDNDDEEEDNEDTKKASNSSLIQQATKLIGKEVSILSQAASKLGSEVALGSLHDRHSKHPTDSKPDTTIGNETKGKSTVPTTGTNKSTTVESRAEHTKTKKKTIGSWFFGSSKPNQSTNDDDIDNLKLGTKGSRSRIAAAVLPPSNRRLDLACYSYSLELSLNSNATVTVNSKDTVRSPLSSSSAAYTPKRLSSVPSSNGNNHNANHGLSTPPVSNSGLFRAATSPFRTNPTFTDSKFIDNPSNNNNTVNIPGLSTELRISVVEATAESAYTAIVPRVLLPLILARRLTNLIQARKALERYLFAYTQGGNYGSSKPEETKAKPKYSSTVAKEEDNIIVHVGPDGSRMRSLPPPPPPKRSPLSVVSSVYGRLVGHIEREEEAKEGLNWLRNRVLYLHAYCADIAATLQGVLGLVPARDGVTKGADALPTNSYALLGIPAALTASVHTTLIAAAAAFAGPALALSDSSTAHDAANLGDGMGEESAALALQLEGANTAATSAAVAAIAGTPISTFRASTRKKDAAVRWLPTNLHTQIVNMTASLSIPDNRDEDTYLPNVTVSAMNTTTTGIYTTGNNTATLSSSSSSFSPTAASNNVLTVPCQPIAVASESLVTVGAPCAHIYEFSGGGGMGNKISKIQSTALSPMLSNGRELAVNAARRDLEDAKLSLKIRADAVIVQAMSAVTTAVAGSIQKALDTATAGPVAAAMVFLNNGRHCLEPLPTATQNAMRAWLRLAHESNEGMAAFRQWLALGMLISWESLLSCVGKERGMLDDMRFGAAIAGNVRYALIDAADSGALEVATGGSDAPVHSLSVEPDITTESAPKLTQKRKNQRTKDSTKVWTNTETDNNGPFFMDNDERTPNLPDNDDAFAENKLDHEDNDTDIDEDDGIDSPTYTGNADTALRPVVLGTAIRVVPSGIFQITIDALGCRAPSSPNRKRNDSDPNIYPDGIGTNNANGDTMFIDFANASSASTGTNAVHASSSEGLVFIIPIAGLRACIRAGLLPRSLLPLPGAPWPLITACPILLTQGINEMQQAAYFMGTTYLQSVINMDAIQALQHYVRAYLSHANNETLRLQAAAAEVSAAIQLARSTTSTATTISTEGTVTGLQRSPTTPISTTNNGTMMIPTPLLDGGIGGNVDAEICGRLYIEYLQHSRKMGGLSPGSGGSNKESKHNEPYPPPPPSSSTNYGRFGGGKHNRFLRSTNEYEDTYLNPKPVDQIPTLSDLGIIDWWGREKKSLPRKDQGWVPAASPSNPSGSSSKKRNTTNNDSTAPTSPPPITIARLAASSPSLPEEIRWLAASTLAAQQSVKLNDENSSFVSNGSLSSWGNLGGMNSHSSSSSSSMNRLPTKQRTVPSVSIQDLPLQAPKLAPLSDRAQLAATVLTALRSALFGSANGTAGGGNSSNGNNRSNKQVSGSGSSSYNNSNSTMRTSTSTSKILSSDTPQPTSPFGPVPSSSYHQSPMYASSSSSSTGSPSATTSAVLSAAVTGDTESEPAAILRLFEDITRILRGTRLTSCKSAKDRTGMAVTLEEARLLAQFEASTITSISTTLQHLTSSPAISPWLPKRATTMDPSPSSVYSSSHFQSFRSVGEYGPMVHATDLPGSDSLCLVTRIPIHTLHTQWLQIFDNLKATLPQGLALAAGTGDLNSLITKLPSTMPHTLGSIAAYLFHPFIYPRLQLMQQQLSVRNNDPNSNNHNPSPLPSIDIQLLRPYDMVVSDIVGMANFLREYGTRLGNAEKNTGTYAFAFSAFQRAFFPAEYRAPTSVIGARVT